MSSSAFERHAARVEPRPWPLGVDGFAGANRVAASAQSTSAVKTADTAAATEATCVVLAAGTAATVLVLAAGTAATVLLLAAGTVATVPRLHDTLKGARHSDAHAQAVENDGREGERERETQLGQEDMGCSWRAGRVRAWARACAWRRATNVVEG